MPSFNNDYIQFLHSLIKETDINILPYSLKMLSDEALVLARLHCLNIEYTQKRNIIEQEMVSRFVDSARK